MRKLVTTFLDRTDGAVVADYVVLGAMVVAMGVTSVDSVRYGTGTLGNRISLALSSVRVSFDCPENPGPGDLTCGASGWTVADPTNPILIYETTSWPAPLGEEPSDPKIDYESLFALDEAIAKEYLDGLAKLSIEEIEKHVQDIEAAFLAARDTGDERQVYAAIDQLTLVHFDVSQRAGTDLYASQLQALYYDWVAAIK